MLPDGSTPDGHCVEHWRGSHANTLAYLREWIESYWLVGVDRFYLLNNADEP